MHTKHNLTAKVRETPIKLSRQHNDALNRRRRIVVQYDAEGLFGVDFQQWLDYRFNYIDEPGSQIDSIWWDIGMGDWAVYPSKILEPYERPGLMKWREQGIDWVESLVEECQRRDLEVFWNHRISEVDIMPAGGLEMEKVHPLKAAHPDWGIRTWWWQGLWNLTVPEVREYKVSILRELAENYDFDGIRIDFARHMPCLPPGRQWEHRAHATEFMRMVRLMLLKVEKKRGRPFLLAAKVPENLKGCRIDSFDVKAWAEQNLVDIFTLGSRSMNVDIAAFRRLTAGRNIELQPCLDDHHATDGYRYPPIEFFRGVFGNWWQQGVDSVETFNWSNATPKVCASIGARPGPLSQRQAYHEAGSPETLRGKDKIFAVERRWGYPWCEGYFNHNMFAPLPATLANDGRDTTLTVRVCEPLAALAETLKRVTLRIVLFGAEVGDRIEVGLNGTVLDVLTQDEEWKDPQIFSPKPQPASGGSGEYKVDPDQRLLLWVFAAPARQFRVGENQVSVRIVERVPYKPGCDIVVEKLEVHADYS